MRNVRNGYVSVNRERLADAVERIKQKNGFTTNADVCRSLNVSTHALNAIIRGDTNSIREELLRAIAARTVYRKGGETIEDKIRYLCEETPVARQRGGTQSAASIKEVVERKAAMKTQGRKGCKSTKICISIRPKNYEFVRVLGGMTGRNMTEVINEIIDEYRQQHPTLISTAQEALNNALDDVNENPERNATDCQSADQIQKARPSKVDGITYRSRSEAHVHCWLKRLEIEHIYEPKRIYLPDLRRDYLPDFNLPALGMYLEVKGFMYKEDAQRITSFVLQQSTPVLIVNLTWSKENGSTPTFRLITREDVVAEGVNAIKCTDTNDRGGTPEPSSTTCLMRCMRCGRIYFSNTGSRCDVCGAFGNPIMRGTGEPIIEDSKVLEAYHKCGKDHIDDAETETA